jgi:hypothetical protein
MLYYILYRYYIIIISYVKSQIGTIKYVTSQFGTSIILHVISQFGELGVGVGVGVDVGVGVLVGDTLVGVGVGVGPNAFGAIFSPPENCIPMVLNK